MEAVLIGYTLLNLAILGLIVLFVRASRARAAPDERQDLEENSLVAADWEWVRRERCLPSGCPRVRGQPPRPRKDLTCEICAATYLEFRLQRLLEAPPAPETADPGPVGRLVEEGRRSAQPLASSTSPALAVGNGARKSEVRPSATGLRRATGTARRGSLARRRARLRFGLGIGCVTAGAVAAAFSGLEWLIIPDCLVALLGLGLMALSLTSGPR